MKKQLTGMLGLSLSAISPLVVALGLGQATVTSPLGAPLEATVPLQESERFALSDLHVEVADESTFKSLGLEWTPLAAKVSVQIQEQLDGHRLLLSSAQAVVEPWLDLLLKVASPEGQQTHALTLLFDPPDYSAIAQPSASDTVLVARGDTLWGVATRVKPEGVSTQQMMLALLDANPDAFPSGSADDIRAGQTLNVPPRYQAVSRTPNEATQALQTVRQPAVRQASLLPNEPAAPSAASSSEASPASADHNRELASDAFSDLAEQLLDGQAKMQQVAEEREQSYRDIQQELAALSQEIATQSQEMATLTQAFNDAQRGVQPSAEIAVSHDENAAMLSSSPSIVDRIAAYQWPLASIALGLLLAALVGLRKRRERQWENVSTTAVLHTAPVAPVTPPPVDDITAETAAEKVPVSNEPELAVEPGRMPDAALSGEPPCTRAEEQWEIEEVAFEPRRRDNGTP
ncbi:FimV family protein [Vreelandella zhaodongensis]|uniref:LysM peptidoglycan-binding domain-containing protein n=1 Tax=Vreelandella zhaodongensis TaxID=1176240 RepID=A0ABX2SU93_VREZH|nr:FimV/HubP family polar landmark protein [Halomonas zhaodongensis]NYS45711.1 LysM peptidoglycan-binding domain-containing protein [Halomonas zhaodongensis]